MKFGEYLRIRRAELGWTQPEAAAKAGIEQSYLSKLETGKSTPSGDVYQRLTAAFGLDAEAMIATLDAAELDRLREIEAVRTGLLQHDQSARSAGRRLLAAGLGMLFLGGGFLGLAQVDRGGLVSEYVYQSSGLILPGEALDIFAGIDDAPEPSNPDRAERISRRDALIARLDERTMSLPAIRGPTFIESLPEGRRLWVLVGSSPRLAPDRFGWALAPGFALLVAALGCLFIRWRKS